MNLLIKGGDVIDGTGGAPKRCDVLIVGGRITAIGNLSSHKADRIIQATGSYILPGFVDVSIAPDEHLSLFEDPNQVDLLKQGVTTVVRGASGKSLAPAIYPETASSINIGWRTMKEYLKATKAIRPSVNFASFTGYETVRQTITTNARNLGIKEINVLFLLLKQSIDEGAAGISFGEKGLTGFGASQAEIAAMIKLLANKTRAALISLKAEDELYALFTDSGIKTIISGINESLKMGLSFNKIATALEKKTPKAEFVFAFSPYPYFRFKIADFFPPSVNTTTTPSLIDNLKKKRIFNFFSKKTQELNLQETFVFNPSRKSANFLIGKSLAEIAENRGINTEETLIRAVEICGEDTIFISQMKDTKVIEKITAHPKSIVDSSLRNTLSSSLIYSKLSEPFIEFLRLSDSIGARIELTAKKLSYPARMLGFKNRGLIKENFAADIVILKNNCPEITIINGKIVYENGVTIKGGVGDIISIK